MNIITFIDILTDCGRRDLTINAMVKDSETGEIIDMFGGQQDILNKTLRHVSKAFAEDPVRVLRIARFNARFGPEWKIAHETKCIIAEMIDNGLLDELTPERVWKETEKALTTGNGMIFFDALYQVGALPHIFPEFGALSLEEIAECFVRCVGDEPLTNSKVAFGLLLLLMLGKGVNIERFSERLRIPNEYTKMITVLNDLNQILFTFNNPLANMMSLFGNPFVTDELLDNVCSDLLGKSSSLQDTIFKCKKAFDGVNFDSISDGDKKWLKGQQIGSEIDRIRIERIKDILET